YKLIAENPESTVVAEYDASYAKGQAYQSEAELESVFIELLKNQGYGYLTIRTEQDLTSNLRNQLEALNQYSFTDKEWDRFFSSKIANQNSGIEEKTTLIQEDYIQLLE